MSSQGGVKGRLVITCVETHRVVRSNLDEGMSTDSIFNPSSNSLRNLRVPQVLTVSSVIFRVNSFPVYGIKECISALTRGDNCSVVTSPSKSKGSIPRRIKFQNVLALPVPPKAFERSSKFINNKLLSDNSCISDRLSKTFPLLFVIPFLYWFESGLDAGSGNWLSWTVVDSICSEVVTWLRRERQRNRAGKVLENLCNRAGIRGIDFCKEFTTKLVRHIRITAVTRNRFIFIN